MRVEANGPAGGIGPGPAMEDVMRRIMSLMASLGLLSSVGCYHVAGVCDCRPPVCPCAIYGLHPYTDYSHQAYVQTGATSAVIETPKVEEAKPITPPAGRE